MAKNYDPIAPWFVAAEALGEYIGIRFGRIAPGTSEPEWLYFRHAEFDGIGGLAKILRSRGATLGPLPQMKHSGPPSMVPLLKLMPKFLQPRRRLKLKSLNGNRKVKGIPEPPPAVAWHVFDEPTTLQMRQACRQAGVTLNSFLLQHLTGAIRPHLEEPASAVPWMIPVNLRGKVVRESDTANYSSYVSVKVHPADHVRDLHQRIYSALDRGEHWANWNAYSLGRFSPHGVKKFLIANELATAQWNIGGFSNLGDWDPEKKITPPDCQGAWLFSPPVLRFQLIGAGCVTFQNRLSLLIQTHPELTTAPAVPAAWIQGWVREIGQGMSALLAARPAI